MERELERLEKAGVIEPVQFSDWAAPIVPIVKRDGSVRICGDYKLTVNRVANVDSYPLPRIEDLLSSIGNSKVFSKLDLANAYQQLELEENSKEYVTVSTHRGLYRYNRLPFGVASAPAVFQRTMETLLRDIPNVCVYLDDVLVSGTSEKQHLQILDRVLHRLHQAGLKLKLDKCSFMLPAVEYLGHVISADGVRPAEDKKRAILEAPAPKNVTQLRSFLGLLNYYGKFLPNLASTLAPLYSLLEKYRAWSWRQEQELAFNKAKQLLTSAKVLVHFDPEKSLLLSCDAYTKWLEVCTVPSCSSHSAIRFLRNVFSTHGIPEVLVSDNGTAFCSEEFNNFVKRNGIRHIRSAPYHPATNGLAERAVQTLKEALKKSDADMDTRIARFLFTYRLTPHATTGISPAELLLKRKPRSLLDSLHPDVTAKAQKGQERQKHFFDRNATKPRHFQPGDSVYVENFNGSPKWISGVVSEIAGPLSVVVDIGEGRMCRRHLDHVRARRTESKDVVNVGIAKTVTSSDDYKWDLPTSEDEPRPAETPGSNATVAAEPIPSDTVSVCTVPATTTTASQGSNADQGNPPVVSTPHNPAPSGTSVRKSSRPHRPPDRY